MVTKSVRPLTKPLGDPRAGAPEGQGRTPATDWGHLESSVCLFLSAAKNHALGPLKAIEMRSLTVPKAKSQNQGVGRAAPPSKTLRENPLLLLPNSDSS